MIPQEHSPLICSIKVNYREEGEGAVGKLRADVGSTSRNKILKNWERPYSEASYRARNECLYVDGRNFVTAPAYLLSLAPRGSCLGLSYVFQTFISVSVHGPTPGRRDL